MFSDEYIKKILKDKTVAIVGPAPHIVGSNLGEEIDKYDIVARISSNSFIPKEMEKDIGSRTDISFNNFNIVDRKQILNNISYFKTLKIVVNTMLVTKEYNEITSSAKNLKKNDVEVFIREDSDIKKIFDEAGTVCNSGIVGILTCLEYGAKKIFIAGFDFYNMGKYGKVYNDYYYDKCVEASAIKRKDNRLLTAKDMRSDIHNQEKQIEYFKKKVIPEYKDKIEFDFFLKELLND